MKSLDLFSCIGNHAIGFKRAGIETVGLCEINPWRRQRLKEQFPGVPIYDEVRYIDPYVEAEIVVGGPPCQQTSVGSAIHGYRSGDSLWPWMLKACNLAFPDWVVVEQPPGNAAWEAQVASDLRGDGWHVARFEFGACDVGAPYLRRRVFLVACTSLPRLEIARQSLPRAIDETKRAADARGDWDPDQLASLPVDARSADEHDGGAKSRERKEWIEALGDSNPPHMAEAIGRAIVAASTIITVSAEN
jgi:DNA (cytosine-5)-methyltransferase 1